MVGQDFASLSWIAASSDAEGVWAWDASATDSRIWHWAPGGDAASWSLGAGREVREGVELPALAACGDRAWFGINDTLFEVADPDGVVAQVTVPSAEPVAAVEAHRPDALRGTSAVNAVACRGTTVAVGRSNAQAALLYDAAAQRFHTVELPEAASVVDVAVNDQGVAAFALQDFNGGGPHEVVLADLDGSRALVQAADSSTIAAVDDGFRVGVAGELLRVDGELTDAAIDAAAPAPGAVAGRSPQTPFVWLDATHYAYATVAGLEVGEVGRSMTESIDLGSGECPDIAEPFNPNSPRTSTTVSPNGPASCPLEPGVLAVDAEGSVYAVAIGGHEVLRVPPAGG